MAQMVCDLFDVVDGLLNGPSSLILDCDSKLIPPFPRGVKDAVVEPILCARQAPNCNAFAERFVLLIKS